MCRLHHAALAVTEFDRYTDLFLKLGMHVSKKAGEKPDRQIWFEEGIQLKEVPTADLGNCVDHIALGTNDLQTTKKIMLENGCVHSEKGQKWIFLPNGVLVELMDV